MMEILSKYISDDFLYSLGWTIFHSIWIGAAVSVVLFFALVLLGNASAKARYYTSVTSLVILVVLVSLVFMRTYNPEVHESVNPTDISLQTGDLSSPALTVSGTGIEEDNINVSIRHNIISFLNSNYSLVSFLWMAGMLMMTIKFAGGFIVTVRFGRKQSYRLLKDYSHLVIRLKRIMGIKRPVKVLESFIARVPLTTGWIKPIIYIPAGVLAGIPYNQVEAIIAHELAHIKRCDYLVNIIQSVLEIILFYHPAVWWISSIIRSERENACDDIALEHSDNKLTYIKALVSISEYETTTRGAAVAFAGDSNNLLNRIKRIAKMKNGKLNMTDRWTSALMSIVILAGVFILSGFSPEPVIDEMQGALTSFPEAAASHEYTFLQVADIIPQDPEKISGKITRTITDPADGKEKDAVFTFIEGELTSLLVGGQEIPEADQHLYNREIEDAKDELADVIEDMEDALEDIEEAMEEIEEIDMAEIEFEVQEALAEIEELDMEKIEFEVQEALREVEELDMEKFEFEIQEALREVEELNIEDIELDMEEIIREYEESFIGLEDIDMEEIKQEMERALKEFREFDRDKMREDILESVKEMEAIDIDKIMKEMEKSMEMINESLRDLEIDQRQMFENQKKDLEARKKELEDQLIEIQEQETGKKK